MAGRWWNRGRSAEVMSAAHHPKTRELVDATRELNAWETPLTETHIAPAEHPPPTVQKRFFPAKRLWHALVLLAAVSFFAFLLTQAAPGDFYSDLRNDPRLSTAAIQGMRTRAAWTVRCWCAMARGWPPRCVGNSAIRWRIKVLWRRCSGSGRAPPCCLPARLHCSRG